MFDAGKWARAADEFNWVVLNNPAGVRVIDAQFHYAECLFHQKKYVEAQVEFERLLRRWSATRHQERARYYIAQCLVEQSPNYYHDQAATIEAISELQQFIEEYSTSEFVGEIETLIAELRAKLAQKNYESGHLYLKLEQYNAARQYFEQVLDRYYDTPFADPARVGTILAHILAGDMAAAEAFFQAQENEFTSEAELEDARRLISLGPGKKRGLQFFLRYLR